MKKKKVFSALLFLIGLGIMLYPAISRTLFDMNVKNEATQIIEAFADDEISDELYTQQITYNQSMSLSKEEIGVAEVSFVKESEKSNPQMNPQKEKGKTNANAKAYLNNENVLGVLSIPRIKIVYPIYDGATYENLLDGVARIEGTSYPVGGTDTNSVIAGHNGLVGRTYFSHIKKLSNDDVIYIQNRKEILTYKVYKTQVIEPDNTDALAPIPGQDTITLLTCTWPPPGTHRYLIYARRVSEAN